MSRSRRLRARLRDEDGMVGGVEMLPFGLLILVAGMLVVTNLWALVDAKLSVASAAREAVRTYVESTNAAEGAAAATTAARAAMTGGGRDPTNLELTWLDGGVAGLARCARIGMARYPVPALTVPWLGGLGKATYVSASATEVVDPYRDGLPGGGCAN